MNKIYNVKIKEIEFEFYTAFHIDEKYRIYNFKVEEDQQNNFDLNKLMEGKEE